MKVLWHDGQGMCLFAKRLERGRFAWPSTVPRENADRTLRITPAQLHSSATCSKGSTGVCRSTPGGRKRRARLVAAL